MRDYRIYNKNLRMHVENTELSQYHYYDESQNFIDFIEIFNIVFPLKVENEYVRLANLTIEYISKCMELEKCQNDIDNKSQYLNSKYNILINLESKVSLLDQELRNIVANFENNKSSVEYEKIASIASQAQKIFEDKETFQAVIEQDRNIHTDYLVLASSLGSDIETIINRIALALQSIKMLDMDENKKIDQLQVTERQYSLIDQLNVEDNKKVYLKKYLKSYFEVKKQSFKIVEDIAIKLVETYKNRKLLDDISETDFRYVTYALTNLSNMNIDSIPDSNYSKEEFNNQIILLDFITNCLIEKDVDSKCFQEIINKISLGNVYIPNSITSVLYDMYVDMESKPLINEQGKRKLQLNYKKNNN